LKIGGLDQDASIAQDGFVKAKPDAAAWGIPASLIGENRRLDNNMPKIGKLVNVWCCLSGNKPLILESSPPANFGEEPVLFPNDAAPAYASMHNHD
jgi:hypothetical protein